MALCLIVSQACCRVGWAAAEMETSAGISATLAGVGAWNSMRRSPFVVVVAGIDASKIVNAALADTALTELAMPRFEPACSPPCDALLWRLEAASGKSLNQTGLIGRHWHRRPYAMTVRLVQYQPGSTAPNSGRRHAGHARIFCGLQGCPGSSCDALRA